MAPPSPAPGRARQQVLGGVLVVIGVVAAVLAVVALTRPDGQRSRGASGQAQTGAQITSSAAPGPQQSPPPGDPAPADTGPAGTQPTQTAPAPPQQTPQQTSEPPAPQPPADARAPVIVLNNTTVNGLAATAAADLRAAGWQVTSTANYSNDILSTAAYYDPSDPLNQAAAQNLQQQFPWIRRVVPRFAELPAGPIVLVLTAQY